MPVRNSVRVLSWSRLRNLCGLESEGWSPREQPARMLRHEGCSIRQRWPVPWGDGLDRMWDLAPDALDTGPRWDSGSLGRPRRQHSLAAKGSCVRTPASSAMDQTALENSPLRLETEWIDLDQLREPDPSAPVEDLARFGPAQSESDLLTWSALTPEDGTLMTNRPLYGARLRGWLKPITSLRCSMARISLAVWKSSLSSILRLFNRTSRYIYVS